MAKIHELLPVETDKVNAANSLVEEAVTTFVKRADHFQGQVTTIEMYDEKRGSENTTNVKELVETVPNKLAHVWQAVREAIDVTLTKENSNTSAEARADVVVNGEKVLTDIPTTGLLALEKRLGQLQNLYQSIPTLPPEYAWEPDPDAALDGVKRTRHPQEGHVTEKVMKVLTLAPATDKHPAQVEKYTMDEKVAKSTIVRTSGMATPAQKAVWLSRIAALRTAVKEARQRANMAEVKPLNIAGYIEGFIHAD